MPPYQLWTSPTTGTRRTGTRLKELQNLFERGITARAIFEPLQTCSSNANAVETAQNLQDKDFDFAGVHEEPNGPVTGFVARSELQSGRVRKYINAITAE